MKKSTPEHPIVEPRSLGTSHDTDEPSEEKRLLPAREPFKRPYYGPRRRRSDLVNVKPFVV
jgi:hypothetical protein